MITLEEFKEIQEDQKYKHIGLFNRSGDPLVRFNSTNKSPEERIEMIETRLKSPSLIDDYYVLKAKNNTQRDTITDDYMILKNGANISENMSQDHTQPPHDPPAVNNKIYSFKEGLDLNSKLIRLELENKHLEIRIQELEKENEEMKKELEELELLSEDEKTPIQDFLQETLKTAIPIMDKFLELKERKIQLAENGQTMQQDQDDQNLRDKYDKSGANFLDQKIREFVMGQDPQIQDDLKQIYNSSGNLDNFLMALERYNQNLFQDFQTYLNGN